MSAYPKPDSERSINNRYKTDMVWTNLPSHNSNPIPSLPTLPKRVIKVYDEKLGKRVEKEVQPVWSAKAKEAWEKLWRTPQSTMWTEDFFSITERWLGLYELMCAGDYGPGVIGPLERIEDRLGLNPKSMLQLRWRYSEAPNIQPTLASVRPIEKAKRADPRGA